MRDKDASFRKLLLICINIDIDIDTHWFAPVSL